MIGRFSWEGTLFIGLLAVLAVCQGGYYAQPACVIGVLACAAIAVSAAARVVSRRISCRKKLDERSRVCFGRAAQAVPALLFAGIGVCGLLSGLAHGLTLTHVSEASSWFVAAALAMLGVSGRDGGETAFGLLLPFGALCSVFGVFMASGVVPYAGSVNAERLQFTFQYANTAGLWFAALGILACAASGSARLGAPFLLSFDLLLTQSVGSITLFAIAFFFLLMCPPLRKPHDRLSVLAQVVLACGAFGVCQAVGLSWAWLVAAVGCILGIAFEKGLRRVEGRSVTVGARILLVALGVAVGVATVAVLVCSGRLEQAGQTFVERLVQMGDAATVLAGSPLLGIAPDAWRDVYPYVQSAQYTAAALHCGYLQIALDAGLVGLLLFLAAVFFGLRRLLMARRWELVICVALILAHVAIDFDLRFTSVAALLAFLLMASQPVRGCSGLEMPHDGNVLRQRFVARVAKSFAVCLVAVGCCAGVWSDGQSKLVESLAEGGGVQSIRELRQGLSLAARDEHVRSCYLEALCAAGNWAEAREEIEAGGVASAEQAVVAAQAYYALGEDQLAEDVLLAELEREPCNVELFKYAQAMLGAEGASEHARQRYAQAAQAANEVTSKGLAALLRNQEHVGLETG